MPRILFIKLSLLILCFCGGMVQAQTSVFTYQGKLTDTNAAANGQYDFTFRLFDALAGGMQIGSGAACNGAVSGNADAVCDNVQVTNGIFTVNLNFGTDAFADGTARFLEISVRTGTSTGAFQPLTPRQQITSSPFSMKSQSATQADTLSSTCVLCVTDGKIQSIDGSKVTGTVANATTAANVSGIVPISNGGTGSSTQNFVDLFSSQTIFGSKNFVQPTTFLDLTANKVAINNNFLQPVTIASGLSVGTTVTAQQFSGSGEGLTNVPGTFKWQTVSGLAQQAERNTGYLANNDAQVTITLPTSPTVGDTVRVSGIGAGGWKIAQNDGQTIYVGNLIVPGSSWTAREGNRNWYSVASSADGNKLVAVVNGGQIYTSTDSGVSWIARESNRNWWSVASSADGNKLVAVVASGQIYTSTDSGVSWIARESNRNWRSVASSADGNKLVAVVYNGKIYISTDSGVSWQERQGNSTWNSIACSADGTKLVAVVFTGPIYTSTDFGDSWTARESNRNWYSVASSADGNKLVAVVYSGQIYTSTDSGISWTARESNRDWYSVASSADGNKLVAVVNGGQIYTSTDSGVSWTARESNRNWYSVASSADGNKLVAVVYSGQIYTSRSSSITTPGTAGFLQGGRYTSIELQYIGNGQFMPISYAGTISAF